MRDVTRLLALGAALYAPRALAGETPVIAQVCTSCHLAESGSVRGTFDAVAFKSTSIQVRVDDSVSVIRFDPGSLEVVQGTQAEKPELLRKVKKANELRVAFVERDGVRYATRVSLMPPVNVPAGELIDTPALERLVAAGPGKGRYTLVDSRPASRFQEGFIPTARSLPFPSLERLTSQLPRDKGRLLVFYGTGPNCSMSARSAERARALGYTRVKIYAEGMQGWGGAHPAALTAQQLEEAWLRPELPIVLLDARAAAEAARAHIPGAVQAPGVFGKRELVALEMPVARERPPILVYDEGRGVAAGRAARQLVAAGYADVKVLEGGFRAWRDGRRAVATGAAASTVAWAPRPRPGELPWAEFSRIARAIPADTVVLDVRGEDEVKEGMIPGARNIPEQDIARRLGELPQDKRIVTHCATGVRAEMAYHVLRERGFERVTFVNANVDVDQKGNVELSR
jgi:rhodanese-related sulfurtransferase